MSRHDRVCGIVSPDGHDVVIGEEPLEKRIAQELAKSADESDRR
jgi:hypothetical protein